jgi:hypothetical protein
MCNWNLRGTIPIGLNVAEVLWEFKVRRIYLLQERSGDEQRLLILHRIAEKYRTLLLQGVCKQPEFIKNSHYNDSRPR